jgi:nitroreductase
MTQLPDGLTRADFVRAVDAAICARRTHKVLGGAGPEPASFAAALQESLEVAGMAPFHFARSEEIPEPWRLRAFVGAGLERVRGELDAAGVLYAKLPAIFGGAGALVQATWLPEARPERDCEHLAAASAAVQNLLLAMHARGFASYWCSAPVLGKADAARILGVDPAEAYLGSLFFGVRLPAPEEAERGFIGKMHARRTPGAAGWSSWTER